jgi:ankyrin repeat protein
MRGRFIHGAVLVILLVCQISVCFGKETTDPNQSSKYLKAVREFADNVLKYGRDTYGPKHTPLFVDGLNANTRDPVKWIDPDGTKWILSNLASQQNLFRTLDGLTTITSEPKYRQAANDAIRYAFDNLRFSNGLFYWGHGAAYDALRDEVWGNTHCLKIDYPHYELMWHVNPNATKRLIEAYWSAHIIDWSNLDFNRIGDVSDTLQKPWGHEYEDRPTFFKSKISWAWGFFSTGTSLAHAGTTLFRLSGQEQPLIWSQRLIKRFVDTRHTKTGISGGVYNKTWLQLGEDMKEHFLDPYTTIFPGDFYEFRYLYYPESTQAHPWLSIFLASEMLGEEGKEFTKWALEELAAWGKVSYRKKDNSFVPMLTDGTNLEGYVWEKGPGCSSGVNIIKPYPADPSFFWTYSTAYRITGDDFMWQMVRDIALGHKLGDIGKTPTHNSDMQIETTCSHVYTLLGFLELYRKTKKPAYLDMARRIGDNIISSQFHMGFFVTSKKHIYTRFDCLEPLALLHLEAAIKSTGISVPCVWPSIPLFVPPYRHKQEGEDHRVIYALTESLEPPISLQEAAAIGDANLVRTLIENGVHVNSLDDSFVKTALHRAAINGHKDVVELLLAEGAGVDARDWGLVTPLNYAVENGHREVASLLIASGADVNATRRGYPAGDTPIHSAVRAGHKEIIDLLIAKKADMNVKNEAGQTPLYLAVRQSSKDIIELLIANGADINAKNNDDQTPLDIAVNQNRNEVVKLLVAKGVDISIHAAARIGDLAIVEKIIQEGTDLNAKDASGKTPLHHAVEYGHKEVVELLAAKGANVNIKDYDGNTPGHVALGENKRSILELLIAKGVNVVSIHLSAYQGELDKVKNYIRKGTDVNTVDSFGATPLHYAAVRGSKEVVEFLIASGADINAKKKSGDTPLHWAAISGSKDVVELLVDNGANINAKGQWDYTPIFYAAWSGIIEVVELLVENLHYRADKDNRYMAEFLIIKGADVQAKDRWGWTPLHCAVDEGNRGLARLLIAKGAEVNTKTNKGATALSIAKEKGHTEIVELLRKHGAK